MDGKLKFFRMNGYALHNDSLWADFTAENVGQYDNRPYNSVDAKYPKEITYANGKVLFDYSSSLLKTVHIYENGAEIQRVTLNYKQLRFMGRSLLTEVNFTELVNNQSRSYTMTTWMTIRRRRPKQWINSDIITDGPVIPIL